MQNQTLLSDPFTSAQQKQRDQYELNDTDWYEVSFKEILGKSTCKLALHKDWMAAQGIEKEGDILDMNLPEQGIAGPFAITSIKHILPQKKPADENPDDDYEYRPVTGIFVHESDDVWTLHFENGDSLGVTANHPIYSASFNDWRLAGELQVGEEVLAKEGNVFVDGRIQQKEKQAVYNLEVGGEHNFLVGDSRTVVHNACLPPVKPLVSAQVFDDWVLSFQPIVRNANLPHYQYQQRILGTLTERRVVLPQPHNFSKNTLDVDGFDASTGTLIDTKFVGNPANSPYTGGSQFQVIQDELIDELNRYKHIIDDAGMPARQMKIVTNHPDAKEYLENLMNSLNIPGGVVMIE